LFKTYTVLRLTALACWKVFFRTCCLRYFFLILAPKKIFGDDKWLRFTKSRFSWWSSIFYPDTRFQLFKMETFFQLFFLEKRVRFVPVYVVVFDNFLDILWFLFFISFGLQTRQRASPERRNKTWFIGGRYDSQPDNNPPNYYLPKCQSSKCQSVKIIIQTSIWRMS